jgi:hypothetical protein
MHRDLFRCRKAESFQNVKSRKFKAGLIPGHLIIKSMKSRITSLYLFLVFAFTQCYYDKEGILYPDSNTCTPSANPSFTNDVMPILEARCNNCHSGSFPSGNIKLDTYNDVMIRVTDGSLMGSIRQTGGFSPMPKNASKLPACDIQKIADWIAAGSLNN